MYVPGQNGEGSRGFLDGHCWGMEGRAEIVERNVLMRESMRGDSRRVLSLERISSMSVEGGGFGGPEGFLVGWG